MSTQIFEGPKLKSGMDNFFKPVTIPIQVHN